MRALVLQGHALRRDVGTLCMERLPAWRYDLLPLAHTLSCAMVGALPRTYAMLFGLSASKTVS
jgi:hypothetical protein